MTIDVDIRVSVGLSCRRKRSVDSEDRRAWDSRTTVDIIWRPLVVISVVVVHVVAAVRAVGVAGPTVVVFGVVIIIAGVSLDVAEGIVGV